MSNISCFCFQPRPSLILPLSAIHLKINLKHHNWNTFPIKSAILLTKFYHPIIVARVHLEATYKLIWDALIHRLFLFMRSNEATLMTTVVTTKNRSCGTQHQEQQLADILNVNEDCFDEIFDYLSIQDLISFNQTESIGRLHFPTELHKCRHNLQEWQHFLSWQRRNVDCFTKFIRKVRIRDGENLKKISAHSKSIPLGPTNGTRLRANGPG